MQIVQVLAYLIILALSYPSALILAKYTKDEKKLYSRYFPLLAWILLVLAIIFYFINIVSALTLTFMFLTIEFWGRS